MTGTLFPILGKPEYVTCTYWFESETFNYLSCRHGYLSQIFSSRSIVEILVYFERVCPLCLP